MRVLLRAGLLRRTGLFKRTGLRNSRVVLMGTMALLLVASTVMKGHHAWDKSGPYDAQCVFDDLIGNIGGTPGSWMSMPLGIICTSYPLNMIVLYERPRNFLSLWLLTKPKVIQDQVITCLKEKSSSTTSPNFLKGSLRRFTYTVLIKVVRTYFEMYFMLLALILSQACSLIVNISSFAVQLKGIIKDRQIPPSEMDGNENAMSFGQIMPILLLISFVLVFWEAYEGT